MSDVILSVPVDASDVDPLLASLEKINQNLTEINASSKGAFDGFSKSLDKSNKKLKETDKTFGDIFKKIKLSGLMKLGAGIIGGAAGLAGVSAGALLFGGLKNAAGNIGTKYQGAGLGMSSAEIKALQVASKLKTGKEDTLVTAMTSLSNALNSGTGGGALANLGLNQEQLKAMSPEKALEAVFQAVKGKGTGIGFEYLRNAFSEVTGLSGQDYNVATKQGASFGEDYREYLAKNKDVDWNALDRGSESLVKFQAQLDIISNKLGGALADPLSGLLDKLSPSMDKLSDRLAKLLDSITQEDVDNFARVIGKMFDFVAWMGDTLFGNNAGQDSFSARDKAFASGDIIGAAGYDLKGGVEQTVNTTMKYLFDPKWREERASGKNVPKSEDFIDVIFGKGSRAKLDAWVKENTAVSVAPGGTTQDITGNWQKGHTDVTVTVKDTSGKVLSSTVTSQGSTKTTSPIRGSGGR